MSSKKYIDKIGYVMGKVHDNHNKSLSNENIYAKVNRIEWYYSNDGIHGFFPFFNNALDSRNKEDSFYKEFKDKYLPKLKSKDKTFSLKYENIKFAQNEFITRLEVFYDEITKKITAIKIKTDKGNKYYIGKQNDINKSEIITKKDNFIAGFKTTYFPQNEISYLSFLQVYYETNDNLDFYYKAKVPSQFIENLENKYQTFKNILSKLSKFFIILFLILFPILIYYYSSQNIYGGELITSHELEGELRLHTDDNGYVHIKADTKNDAYFGLGFVHAKERLWQMDFMRRVARGKLSEIFGEKTLEVDKLMRSLGINNLSIRNAQYFIYYSKYKALFQKYIEGINYYGKNFILPVEYHISRANFDNWEIADTIAIQNLMTFTLSHDWNMELWYKIMEESLGKEFADLIISFRDSNFPFANETIINDDELKELNLHKFRKNSEDVIKKERDIIEKETKSKNEETKRKNVETKIENVKNKTNEQTIANNKTKLIEENQNDSINKTYIKSDNSKLEEGLEMVGNMLEGDAASNSWVISGKFTQSGLPMLSNDPHLSNSMPSLFFIAKIYLPDNTLVGATIPGLPIFTMGSNKYISFGFTTENSDIVDICEEQIEDNHYIYDKTRIKLAVTEEVINIKGQSPLNINIKWTRNGPLVEGLAKQFILINLDYKSKTPLSIRFTWYFFDYTGPDFYLSLNFAQKPEDFLQNIESHISPNLNLIWATRSGDIGYTPIGKWPIKNYINRFCRGYTSADDVIKYVKRVEIPQLINPKKGFIITANNRALSFNYTYNIHGFYNQVRANRIREMIEEKMKSMKKFNIEDNIEILKDVKDKNAEYTIPQILEILKRNKKANLNYYEELSTWDYVMDKNSTTATVWAVLELNLARKLLKSDEQISRGIISFPHYWHFIAGIIEKIHNGEIIDLKQCGYHSGSTNCEKYIIHIFSKLDDFLDNYRDNKGKIRTWGEFRFNDYPHNPMDTVPVLNKLFSRRFYTGGNRFTVKIGRGPFNHPKGEFISTHSPRLKYVSDLAEPTKPYLVIDAGNSGNILSRYYDNLMHKSDEVELEQMNDYDFENEQVPNSRTIVIRYKLS